MTLWSCMMAVSVFGQQSSSTVDNLKVLFKQHLSGYHFVGDAVSHRNYQGKEIKGNIDGLFDLDVMKYYRLNAKYDSPLKRKMFMQSKDYQTLVAQMETERQYLLADTFYVVSEIQKTNYDLTAKAFFFFQWTNSLLDTSTRFVNLGRIGIVTQLLTDNGIKVEIENENVALKVENNYKDCRLVYIFTFDEGLSLSNREFPIGKMQRLMLVNVKNGEVYYNKARKIKLVQYDHDIYAEMDKVYGEDCPVGYYLKVGSKMIRLALEEPMPAYEEYQIEIEGDKYYVFGLDGKKYLLHFKPRGVVAFEKDAAYEAKCKEIAKDYKLHPERYQDLTKEVNGGHYYIDKSGNEWVFETEGGGFHVLEDEGVYMLFDELKFVRKKDAQTRKELSRGSSSDVKDDKVYDVVEQMPSFPGGPSALFEYLAKSIKYPVAAKENGVQGRVIVTYVVECDGSITDVRVVKSVDPSLDKEAIRVVKSMPKWVPGMQKGTPVRVKYTVPVTFRLQ